MVMFPLFHIRSPFRWKPDVMIAQGTYKEHKDQKQGEKDWHNDVLSCCIPDVLLAHNEEDMTAGKALLYV